MSHFDTVYCCMGCHWRGPFGELIGAEWVHCPKCHSTHLEMANGDIQEVDPGHGWKPDVLQ
jgi:Zn finger protein HypA/HybF involved in hydrogenase expression